MDFSWLKKYVPVGLYGRAALILLVPIVTLQVIVSVIFIQRHYEDVTRQMTRNLALDINFFLDEVDASPSLVKATTRIGRLSAPMEIEAALPPKVVFSGYKRNFFDLSGRVVITTVTKNIAAVRAIDLKSNTKIVTLWVDTKFGPAQIAVNRRRVSASNPHQFLVLMAFVGIVMALVSFIFLRNQLRPIRRLAFAADAFGKGRIVRYKPSGATEVRSAGAAFLDMRARIERQIEQRTLMLSGVSHDLRTPITRLKLGLSMLDDDEIPELVRDVAEMERLLDEFLAFARGDMLDDLSLADPVELTRAVVEKIARTGGSVTMSEVEGAVEVQMRPIAIERALDNLIGNALRYGSNAVVNITLFERAVTISVEDDGPGIPPDKREQALKPFARLDASRNQDKGSGVGLGLSIAYDIARRHGGSLRLGESEDLGGLKVDLVLPR